MIRFYDPQVDVAALEALVALCHPARAPRERLWWQLVPTLVMPGSLTGTLTAYTQFSLGDRTMYLYDTGVHPEARRRGLARRLMAERLLLGERLGLTEAVGMTEPSNQAMLGLLLEAGFTLDSMREGYYRELTPPGNALVFHSTDRTYPWARQALQAVAA